MSRASVRVDFRACPGLARHLGGAGRVTLVLAPGATVRAALTRAGVPEDEVWLVAVNGVKAAWDRALAEGDEVMAFAPVGGG